MKKEIIYAVILLVIVIIAAYMGGHYKQMEEDWKISTANMKAYNSQLNSMLSKEKGHSAALQLTIDQLHYFQDSITKKLDETRKELKIKEKIKVMVVYRD